MTDALLETYLQDHYAGAVGGVELARRVEENNKGTELEERFRALCVQIEEDRDTLSKVLETLGVEPSLVKDASTWAAEKLGRLKLNGALTEYSPLSRVLEVELLIAGVNAKRTLWMTLAQTEPDGAVLPVEQLIERAESQLDELEDLHGRAVDLAFTTSESG